MTRSFLIIAALSLAAPVAMAQVQNAGPQGSNGGNNVGAAVAPAPAPAASAQTPAPSANPAAMAQSQPTGTINPSSYKTETECLNAATAAHASTDACMSLPKN